MKTQTLLFQVSLPEENTFSTRLEQKRRMSVAIHKVIEVLSESDKSWEDAADRAVKDAAKSLQGDQGDLHQEFSG